MVVNEEKQTVEEEVPVNRKKTNLVEPDRDLRDTKIISYCKRYYFIRTLDYHVRPFARTETIYTIGFNENRYKKTTILFEEI